MSVSKDDTFVRGIIFNIQRYSIHDGPGIRTIVFLKGCPLRCRWCSNPESQKLRPELGFIVAKCNHCGNCIEACPQAALSFGEDRTLLTDRRKCNSCGVCVPVCYPEALTVYGKEMTAEEVLEEVRLDELFYKPSGGGVTASGGEALSQHRFIARLFKLCHEAGIHTCLEVAGYARAEVLQRLLILTDYVLFDLKHMDPNMHRKLTGKPNELILENAKMVVRSGTPVLFRMPLIPGLNDDLENIKATVEFVKALGEGVLGIELLPYHRLGMGKYQALGRQYLLKETKPSDLAGIESIRQDIENMGLRCTVSK